MSKLDLDPRTYARALDCVHCGLCLPACPTYTQDYNEADSPRGRINLMRGLADGAIDATPAVLKHLDLCLDCRACETACPSGVVYHELIEETREKLAPQRKSSASELAARWMFLNVFTRPSRLKLALLPVRILQRTGAWRLLDRLGFFKILPRQFQKMAEMLPPRGKLWPRSRGTGESPVSSKDRGRIARAKKKVAFHAGCIGDVLGGEINQKAIELLRAAGAEVIVSKSQVCCGAIHHHNGEDAKNFAKQNINAMRDVDAIVTAVAGCGAMLKEYDRLLRDDPGYANPAADFAGKVRDISQMLVELGLPKISRGVYKKAAYHDACHLAHAQKITQQPREILAAIPGLAVVPLSECDVCCGAAGTYNLTEPEMSAALAERKIRHLQESGAEICVTGNVGCAMQIRSTAAAKGVKLEVLHPVELLHRAVFDRGDAQLTNDGALRSE